MGNPKFIKKTLEQNRDELISGIMTLFKERYDSENNHKDKTVVDQEFIHSELTTLFDDILHKRIDTKTREVTILLSDLRGFTSLAEQLPPSTVIEMLNRYFSKMSEIIITEHDGVIDKFMGDSIMVLFGARRDRADDLEQALSCSVKMQIAMDEINRENQALDLPTLYMGIGINTGAVITGKVGSELHSEYTVIGDEGNLASRIQAFSLRGQILLSENTYQSAKDYIETDDPVYVYVKGKKDQIVLHELLSINHPEKLSVPRRELRKSPRIEVDLPFTYQLVDGKKIQPGKQNGQILDIGYNGFLCVLPEKLDIFTEIKVTLSVSILGGEVSDIYAKVLRSKEQDGQYLTNIEFTSVHIRAKETIKLFIDRIIQGGGVVK